jgi:hypothetical protein
MPHLIVIYGAPLTGKTSLARELAHALGEKSAVVSVDALLNEAIRLHDRDVSAELDMVYTQTRLLVANYLKNRYHVVLEGAFLHDKDGAIHGREQEIDQTLGLMRNLAWAPLTVRLTAAGETLSQRIGVVERPLDLDVVQRIDAGYRVRYGGQALELRTDERSAGELTAEILEHLQSRQF